MELRLQVFDLSDILSSIRFNALSACAWDVYGENNPGCGDYASDPPETGGDFSCPDVMLLGCMDGPPACSVTTCFR